MKKLAAVVVTTLFAMSGPVFAAAHMAGEKPKNPCAKAEMKDAKKDMKDEKKEEKKEMKDEKKK